jgi:hypothetical protein
MDDSMRIPQDHMSTVIGRSATLHVLHSGLRRTDPTRVLGMWTLFREVERNDGMRSSTSTVDVRRTAPHFSAEPSNSYVY